MSPIYTSHQQIIDRVYKHFIVDKNPQSRQISENRPKIPVCTYSKPGCAIGCLIEDKQICQKWDKVDTDSGTGIYLIEETYPDDYNSIFGPAIEIDFLADLQDCHDLFDPQNNTDTFAETMNRGIAELVVEYGLEDPARRMQASN